MSQRLLPPNIRLCSDCKREIDEGKHGNRSRCHSCTYKRRKLILKINRLKKKKCKGCGGLVGQSIHQHYCSDYCKWIKSLKSRHYKIIMRLEDLTPRCRTK